ncbi:outer membrane beta-barrel protein [Pedobacter sp. V48]|uniref:outer membrane beta-barrel protein n=1 Tax=Pedobacter sp. V48 TaxID=509635 RepID=UPI0004BBB416|nr:outer membrane beta-barrel protein [Pedobacter sp. V48]
MMTKKILAILAIGICIAPIVSFAQQTEVSISGQIRDAENKAFNLATVALLSAKDSVVLKSTFTEGDGKFSFNQLKTGNYQIKVSAMGYTSYKSEVITLNAAQPDFFIPNIKLIPSSNSLNQVNITGKKSFIEHKIDRVIVNVDALISNTGSTALEVLEKSPGVQVDQNGVISLKGKQGVLVLIDDKPTYLSGADLENYLKSLPSSSLDQIEIMTNPPAKYDAAGNAGVINIRTKKGSLKGFNGGFNLSLNQGQKTRTLNSLNFNLRNNKFNYFLNFSYNYNTGFSDLDINRTYKNADNSPKSYFNQNSYFDRHGNSLNAKAGVDYYQSDDITWGILVSGMSRASTQINNNSSHLLNSLQQLDSVIKAKNIDVIDFSNGGVNLNYRHQFDKKGHGITADADYLAYRNKTDQTYYNSSFFADGSLKSEDILTGYLPGNIDIYSVKTDYSLPLKSDWKLASGLKISYAKTDNTADYAYTIKEVTKADFDKSNHFIYKEHISAGYLNLNREMKKFSIQLGLRLENTISDGHQLGNAMKPDSAFKRNYTGLFPTVYVLYKLDTAANNQLGLNYGRRIDRPYYQDLNPFISPLDKFTFYVGNPFLRPSYTQSIELSHTYKNKYTTTISYSKSRDEVNETIEILNGSYYSRPGNIGKKRVKSISFNGTLDVAKWLSIDVYEELTNITTISDFYTGKLNTSGTFYFTSANAKFAMGSGWDAELSGNYRNRIIDVQFELKSVWQASTAIQKKLSPSTTLKLAINDLFYSRINRGVINNLAQTEANWTNKGDSRTAVLSFNYRFGKAFTTPAKHGESGAESEKNRVKN